MSSLSTMKLTPSLVVFGPQITTWPSQELLAQLRELLIQEPRLSSFLQAIKDLPKWMNKLVEFEPPFSRVSLTQPIAAILNWIEHGELINSSDPFPNSLLAPLTIVIQYLLYFRHVYAGKSTRLDPVSHSAEHIKPADVQGLCTGFLTASALSFSTNVEDLDQYAPVALRLALAIGATVDLDAAESEYTSCLAVRWRADSGGKAGVEEVLATYTDAYISVASEPNCVTVTAPASLTTNLANVLASQGYVVKEFGLHGRYHSPALERSLQTLLRFCESNPELQLPSAEKLLVPLRSPITGEKITNGNIHEIALQSILTNVFDWNTTITTAASDFAAAGYSNVIMASMVNCVPKALSNDLNLQITNLANSKPYTLSSRSSVSNLNIHTPNEIFPPNAVAVVGMAGKFPGAESLSEFWELIRSGGSMTEEVPESRFSTKNLRRTTKSDTHFWGNFLKDVDSFDHRFFKKSAREAVQMDPQQRLLLEVAYQAVESSGYFNKLSDVENDIGCFIGLCASDYNDNVASHPPTAYSSLGTLRAFLSGKISHYFGWSGPSVTYDTACSSSAVAIDAACKSIISGDCSQAVAGGVNVFTSANFYQNLMAASFLSPTGATKSFDSRADGYCRGEGVGLVVLKKLSAAMADGDNILGVISATAVNQNNNAVPITVPYAASQVALYEKVTRLADIDPTEISYVEAHGTGTPVGDPIECDSIRQVFGGPRRDQKLYLGSIKANIGHTEGTSGVAGLIKVLLMMQHRTIPVQANFISLNPKIRSLAQDGIEIPVISQDWNAKFLAACVNNYGAAGSNAAMVVCQAPTVTAPAITNEVDGIATKTERKPTRYPIYVAAHTASSLNLYLQKLLDYVSRSEPEYKKQNLLESLAFTLQKTQNRSHPHIFATTVSELGDLRSQLEKALSGSTPCQTRASTKQPLILAFGGQVGDTVGLPIEIYKSSSRLRFHLDECATVLQQLGFPSIFPDIFVSEPVTSVISLHSMLFSVQYSFAKTWMDCGLKVDGIIGHSFGQLTALCISGSLSLKQGLELVAGRAALMQAHWDKERGSMISIEADSGTISTIVTSVNAQGVDTHVEVACYNGPTSHVLVGSENSIRAVEAHLSGNKSLGISKWKVLNVPYGFHSRFTEPILPGLLELTRTLEYKEPQIPLETCSEGESWGHITAELVAGHSRAPVYFGQAVRRITDRFGPCSWLEAGMNSSIANMSRRALDDSTGHQFYPVNFSPTNSFDSLAKITLDLQKSAQDVHFWPFHDSQRDEYEFLQLPPYQFDKTRHWLEWVDYSQPVVVETPAPEPAVLTAPPTFMTTIAKTNSGAEFLFNPQFDEYKVFVQGHRVLNNPLCPAPLYLELVARGIKVIAKDTIDPYLLEMKNLEIKAPLGLASNRLLTLKVEKGDGSVWTFEFSSRIAMLQEGSSANTTSHASGTVTIQKPNSESLRGEQIRYERLIGYDRAQELTKESKATSMQGSPVIYKVFEKVVHYDSFYKGIQRISARDHEVVGLVHLPRSAPGILKDTAYHPLMLDNFVQVSGLHVNALSQCNDGEVYVCTKLDRIQPTPAFENMDHEVNTWTVYSSFTRFGERDVINDIFVFDTETKELVVFMLGARFTKVAMNSLGRVLANANTLPSTQPQPIRAKFAGNTVNPTPVKVPKAVTPSKMRQAPTEPADSGQLFSAIKVVLSKVVEVDVKDINVNTTPDELGIDSLMVTEVLSDIQKAFGVEIPLDDFVVMEDVNALFQYLRSRIKGYSGSNEVPETRPLSSGASEEIFSDRESDAVDTEATSAKAINDIADDEYQALSNLVNKSLEREEGMTEDVILADAGMDSLLCMEVVGDIEKEFGIRIDPTQITNDTTFGQFFEMVFPARNASSRQQKSTNTQDFTGQSSLASVQEIFHGISRDYDIYAEEFGFAGFWKLVYPAQARLVLAYVVEAFNALGTNLASLSVGSKLPQLNTPPKHDLLVAQLYRILEDGSLIQIRNDGMFRTNKRVDPTPSATLFDQIVKDFPLHASEHKLLHITGSKLAGCLTGTEDALMLLFRPPANRKLLEDVYQNGPMYASVTKQLSTYFSRAFATPANGEVFEILELGGGTGGTTKYLVDYLSKLNIPFRYTFTDVSGSLVNAMQRKLGNADYMAFAVVDIEKPPEKKHLNKYHAILSTNCIHATTDLTVSGRNIRSMLREDGFIALVEFTRNMFWFDLVFGLLDGWWFFKDGRSHVLADEFFWERSLRSAGFKHVTWTGADTEESNTLRIITAFQREAYPKKAATKDPHITEETVLFKQVGSTPLFADLYYPSVVLETVSKRPIALMIHGGGHMMLSRKDVRPKQTAELLRLGFLPVSVDYRLCPEVDIQNGIMTDVRDAIQWARYQLPALGLGRSDIVADGNKLVVVGWSTGGTIAMTTAWTTVNAGLPPPSAIFALYCPTDYEDECWLLPNYPNDSTEQASVPYDLLEGVEDQPITAYKVPANLAAAGGWMAPSDPRSRIVLHNNWHGQVLPTIINGLPTRTLASADPAFSTSVPILPQPPLEQIQRISPLAQICTGAYNVPTFLLHTDVDDLIPIQQAQRTFDALQAMKVPESKLVVVKGVPHLFDLYRRWMVGEAAQAVDQGYEWLAERVGL